MQTTSAIPVYEKPSLVKQPSPPVNRENADMRIISPSVPFCHAFFLGLSSPFASSSLNSSTERLGIRR